MREVVAQHVRLRENDVISHQGESIAGDGGASAQAARSIGPERFANADDALDYWWHEDHFGETCPGELHSEQCVETAFIGGWYAREAAKPPALPPSTAQATSERDAPRRLPAAAHQYAAEYGYTIEQKPDGTLWAYTASDGRAAFNGLPWFLVVAAARQSEQLRQLREENEEQKREIERLRQYTGPNASLEDASAISNLHLWYEPTGEHRPPMAGEWFRAYRGEAQARFDFSVQEFDILRQRLELCAGERCERCVTSAASKENSST